MPEQDCQNWLRSSTMKKNTTLSELLQNSIETVESEETSLSRTHKHEKKLNLMMAIFHFVMDENMGGNLYCHKKKTKDDIYWKWSGKLTL